MQGFAGNDTIVAIATPPGPGGIGMVRISGPGALAVLEGIWLGRPHPSKFEARKLYLGGIDLSGHPPSPPSFAKATAGKRLRRAGGSPITDRVMAVYMPSPKTYTGEDVVEISCHGSQVILSRIVSGCVAAGARVADPGEFTRRAFLAGKLDLAQAEAVCDLIAAQSEQGARIAAEQLEGRLSDQVRALASEIADIRAVVEAHIDFPEEEVDSTCGVAEGIDRISSGVAALSATYSMGRLVRQGVRVAIVGRPNAGKSSVLNRLAGRHRAIVHHEPGTTRDVVEEMVNLGGVIYRLRDTAGVRDFPSDVERLGIQRSEREIAGADLALVIFDGSREFCAEDERVISLARDRRTVYAVNKADLPQKFDIESLDAEPVRVSALTGIGFDALVERIGWAISSSGHPLSAGEGAIVTSERHRSLLDQSISALQRAALAQRGGEPLECTAQHLRQAQGALGRITGEVTTEEILDRIFSKFCIGK